MPLFFYIRYIDNRILQHNNTKFDPLALFAHSNKQPKGQQLISGLIIRNYAQITKDKIFI